MTQTAETDSRLSRFILELTPGNEELEDIQTLSARSRAACDEMSADTAPIRFLRSLFVPEDGSCFLLFEAASLKTVEEVTRRALVPAGPVWELQRT
jgi:hypothetical protein